MVEAAEEEKIVPSKLLPGSIEYKGFARIESYINKQDFINAKNEFTKLDVAIQGQILASEDVLKRIKGDTKTFKQIIEGFKNIPDKKPVGKPAQVIPESVIAETEVPKSELAKIARERKEQNEEKLQKQREEEAREAEEKKAKLERLEKATQENLVETINKSLESKDLETAKTNFLHLPAKK